MYEFSRKSLNCRSNETLCDVQGCPGLIGCVEQKQQSRLLDKRGGSIKDNKNNEGVEERKKEKRRLAGMLVNTKGCQQ